MPERNLALKRRIAPSTPLTLMLEEQGGGFYRQELKLAFNMNAGVAIQEQTGLLLTDTSIWAHAGEPKVLRAMLWAAALMYQPEYDTGDDEGIETIGSYIQEENSDQIVEALWKAYLAYLPPAKREFLAKTKAEAEARRGETVRPLDETKLAPSETKSSAGPSFGPLADTTSVSAMTSSGS